MRRLAATLVALALVLLAPSPAHAGSTAKKDRDDTAGVLDLKKVTLQATGRKIVATWTTHDAWSEADLAGTAAAVSVDFRTGPNRVRGILVNATSGSLRASVCTVRLSDFRISQCSRMPLERPSASSVRVTVPRAKIVKGARSYRWHASSTAQQGTAGCSAQICQDVLPQDRDAWYTWRP